MIVAIDGPAGSGKSTIARALARRLGLTYLDTGAMYRVVTLLALEQDVPLESDSRLGCLAREMDVRFVDTPDETARVLVGDRDVTNAIRNPLVSQKVSLVAAHRQVRQALLRRQRQLAEQGDMVLEGRDIGTVVCPRAELKVYLTASAEVRATRRRQQLEEQGVCISQNALERELLLRDSRDSGRVLAPLRKARDAVEIDTSALTVDQVLDLIVEHAAANEPGEGTPC